MHLHVDDYANNTIPRVKAELEDGPNLLHWQKGNLWQTPAGSVQSWDQSVILSFELFDDEQTSQKLNKSGR